MVRSKYTIHSTPTSSGIKYWVTDINDKDVWIPDYKDKMFGTRWFLVEPPTFFERFRGITMEYKCRRILDYIHEYLDRFAAKECNELDSLNVFATFLADHPDLQGDIVEG